MIISAEKTLDKIQHAFMIKKYKKKSQESGYRGNLIILKAIYDKSIANITLTGENLTCLINILSGNLKFNNEHCNTGIHDLEYNCQFLFNM